MDTQSEPTNRIRELREAQKLTQKELAKLVDLDHTTISKHESGARSLGRDEILKYARVFKCETYEVFLEADVDE